MYQTAMLRKGISSSRRLGNGTNAVVPSSHVLGSTILNMRRRRRGEGCGVSVKALHQQGVETLQSLDALETILRHHMVMMDATSAAVDSQQQDNGWLTPLVDGLETVLRFIQTGFDKYNVPYSYGWSIVTLTLFVKTLTFPLTKIQVEGTMSMQALKPEIDVIKEKYGDDKDAISRETSALYEKAKVNPLAGCLPTLATIPIFIGLYRSFSSVASQGDLDNQGFYWIPTLAGPTSIAAQKAGEGTAWLFPFVDGHPPIGWDLASSYLVLPVALVLAQYASSAIISPPIDPNSENANVQKALYYGLPLMIGWFSLNLPSGLSLYYFTNTVFTSAQQIFLRKLGGAQLAEYDLGPLELGTARRTGTVDTSTLDNTTSDDSALSMESSMAMSSESVDAVNATSAPAPALRELNRRCKRKRVVA